jgi:hypothetical protein
MTFNRTHVFKSYGIWELPAGRGKTLRRSANRLIDRAVGGWKLSGMLTMTSGRPFSVSSPPSTYTKYTTGNAPDVTGVLGKDTGQLQFDERGACFFCGFKQITDPSIGLLTASLASQSRLFAHLAANGVILKNPLPGTLGNLAHTLLTGPNLFNIDLALNRQFRLTERFDVEVRTDWLNTTNRPDFSGATIGSNINSSTFACVTGGGGANRIIVLGARLSW